MALPFLEYFLPRVRAMAAIPARRVLYCYLGNGAQWTPTTVGTGFTLPTPLADLATLKDYVTVVSGLNLGPANGSMAGDHARAGGAFLTGKTCEFPGPTNLSRSIDLMISDVIGKGLKYPNLCFGGETHSESDTGYSAAFTNHISWLGGASPNTLEIDPGAVFDRMFSAGVPSPEKAAMQANGKSILDFVQAEAKSLDAVLGVGDKIRLEDYLQSIRELELRLGVPTVTNGATCKILPRPSSTAAYQQNIGLIYDVLFQAMSCGLTNVASFVVASETSSQGYAFIGVNGGHHSISHDSSPAGYESIAKIAGWHIGQFAAFCQKLKAIPEGDGNMLDNSVMLFSAGLGDGSQHIHTNLPVVLVGKGGGVIPGGRHIKADGTAFCNLHLTVANALGLPITQFGDSSAALSLS